MITVGYTQPNDKVIHDLPYARRVDNRFDELDPQLTLRTVFRQMKTFTGENRWIYLLKRRY